MRIAIIDHVSVAGGIIRYATNLAKALKQADAQCHVSIFTTQKNFETNKSLFQANAEYFETVILGNTKTTFSGSFYVDIALYKLFGTSRGKLLNREIYQRTKGYDLVYFTCAHASDFIPVRPKSMATYHDLNWKYLFGTPLFSGSSVASMNTEIVKWLNSTGVIVSSPYVKNEIRSFYPDVKCEINVVFLPNLAKKIQFDPEKRDLTYKKFGISRKYILCPAHLMPHKNHLNLFSAFHKFRQTPEGKDYMLILTGHATDHFKYAKAIHIGAEMASSEDFDILGLGYVSNEEVDVLIKNASFIVSASLHEAGSGPALDGWINEVPVILSSIEPHMDQLEFFKIDCPTFDPMNIDDIADKISYAATNLDELREQSKKASKAFDEYSWIKVGKKYLEIFKNHIVA
jgi:glycosyltransferase involved in cell wall biosynthesis